MVTTYDEIWTRFLGIKGRMSNDLIPTTNDDIYIEIHTAVENYNTEINDYENNLNYEDATECINVKLDSNRLKLLALLIKENICQSQLEIFQEIYQFDIKETKSKSYRDQVSARQATINKTRKEIETILKNIESNDFNG